MTGARCGAAMRWAFRALIAGTACLLMFDIKAVVDEQGGILRAAPQQAIIHLDPVLPPTERLAEPAADSIDPREHLDVDHAQLRRPLSMELRAGGVLHMEGNIDIGAAQRVAKELDAHGQYVRLVTLNSPGGSLDDAMLISSLIREYGLATKVEDGAVCASSCPLIMAGGLERMASPQAAIGLHQFYAGTGTKDMAPSQAMAEAQTTAARISRHLATMEVDPALWLHALDTPPQSLYYLSVEEMRSYRLVNHPIELASHSH